MPDELTYYEQNDLDQAYYFIFSFDAGAGRIIDQQSVSVLFNSAANPGLAYAAALQLAANAKKTWMEGLPAIDPNLLGFWGPVTLPAPNN